MCGIVAKRQLVVKGLQEMLEGMSKLAVMEVRVIVLICFLRIQISILVPTRDGKMRLLVPCKTEMMLGM